MNYFYIGIVVFMSIVNENYWTAGDKLEFMESCMSNAVKSGAEESRAEEYCTCMFMQLSEKFDYPKDVVKLTKGEAIEMKNKCKKEFSNAADTDSTKKDSAVIR
ncbi:hypothetical protein N9Q76_01220 [Flavobacteriales bacterium]|nr:hypothetical protein [Flavobacteriales bacterium]